MDSAWTYLVTLTNTTVVRNGGRNYSKTGHEKYLEKGAFPFLCFHLSASLYQLSLPPLSPSLSLPLPFPHFFHTHTLSFSLLFVLMIILHTWEMGPLTQNNS